MDKPAMSGISPTRHFPQVGTKLPRRNAGDALDGGQPGSRDLAPRRDRSPRDGQFSGDFRHKPALLADAIHWCHARAYHP